MIIVCIVSLFISLLIQGLMSNFFGYTLDNLSIFSAVYVLINLVVIQQYFEDNKKNLIVVVIFGLLVDLVYNNTVLLSTCIFFVIYYLNKTFSLIFPYNLFTINIFSLVSMVVYHVITFIFLVLLRFDSYGILILFKVIGCNIIMTIIYTSFLYLLIDFIYKKFDLKLIREK